jgi:protein-disulfide isomerase
MGKDRRLWVVYVLVPILILVLITFVLTNREDSNDIGFEGENISENNDDLYYYRRGSEKPLVVLKEYSDFFCQHCASVQPILDALLDEFAGKLALEYHHYSFMGSSKVHEANECAGEQGKFWEFHEQAFLERPALTMGGRDAILDLASNIDLEIKSFKDCLDDNRYKEKVIKSRELGSEQYGINATPTFVIEDEKIEILPDKGYYETLHEKITEILEKPFA